MPREKLQITSINAGFAPTQDFGPDGSYQFGLAIDPDYSLTTAFYRKSAALIPTRYEKFSTSMVTGSPNWLITNPKNTNVYTYVNDPSATALEFSATSLAADANLKAYWKLEDVNATTGGFTLTNNNTVGFNAGKFTNAADFGAANTNKYLSVASNSIFAAASYSWSFWVNPTNLSGNYTLIGKDKNAASSRQLSINLNSGTGRISVEHYSSGNTQYIMSATSGALTAAAWNHVAVVNNAGVITIYVNNVACTASASGTYGAMQDSSGSALNIGRREYGGSEQYFSGLIDDVTYFNRALAASEVSEIYVAGGKFISYDNALGTETLVASPSAGVGNGMTYYNNYIYLAINTNVSRYGPLDGTPAFTSSFWVSTLSKTALNNKAYPMIAGVSIPNHPMHVHGDNALYFGDTLNGQGIIHKIKTTKTTNEGDTNDSSAYNALDLPFGFFPTDIESYGTDLAIVAIQTTDSDSNQGRAAMFLWDTVSDTFYAGPIYLPDPLGTALLNVNGQIIVWSGSARQGCRVSKYLGGVQLSEMFIIEEACPPFAGAVAADGSRIYWGGFTVYPTVSACVYSFGSKDGRLSQGLHVPIRTSSAGATPNATSLALYSQTGFARTKLVVGWKDASTQGIDKLSTSATYAAKWRSQPFNLGKKSRVALMRIPLGTTLAANMTITPTLYFDDESSSLALSAINSTNFSGRHAQYKDIALKTANFENSFFLELAWTGTVECPVKFPIEIEVETFDNEK